jgi:hypothetical protein
VADNQQVIVGPARDEEQSVQAGLRKRKAPVALTYGIRDILSRGGKKEK